MIENNEELAEYSIKRLEELMERGTNLFRSCDKSIEDGYTPIMK